MRKCNTKITKTTKITKKTFDLLNARFPRILH